MRLAVAAFVPLALLAGCSSASKQADDPRVTVTASPDTLHPPLPRALPYALSFDVPYGDGQGGFVWLDGTAATQAVHASTAEADLGKTAGIDLDLAVREALDRTDGPRWEAVARAAALAFADGRGLHAPAVAQQVDRRLVSFGLH